MCNLFETFLPMGQNINETDITATLGISADPKPRLKTSKKHITNPSGLHSRSIYEGQTPHLSLV